MPQADKIQIRVENNKTKHHSVPKCHIIVHRTRTEANETGRQERDSPWRETIFSLPRPSPKITKNKGG